MKITCVERSDTNVVVRIEPGWFAKVFLGEKATLIELGRAKRPGSTPGTVMFNGWRARGSNRPIEELPHADRIANAIDFRPVEDP